MAIPVARLASGRIIDVDLAGGITASEARRRIAIATDIPFGRVRVVSPLTHMALQDNDEVQMEVGVVLLQLDPETEKAAAHYLPKMYIQANPASSPHNMGVCTLARARRWSN